MQLFAARVKATQMLRLASLRGLNYMTTLNKQLHEEQIFSAVSALPLTLYISGQYTTIDILKLHFITLTFFFQRCIIVAFLKSSEQLL